MQTKWINAIQDDLLMHLCLQTTFRRRYSAPIAPWMTEKFFTGTANDKVVVLKVLHQLVHSQRIDRVSELFATPQDSDLFWVYEHLHEIIAHFGDSDLIATEFRRVFADYENLIFKNPDEKLTAIKNVPCLQRALKSILEIKSPHFLDQMGFDILNTHGYIDLYEYPRKHGKISQEEMITIYKLCASNKLQSTDALTLFYSVYVEGKISLPAQLNGIEDWKRLTPFLINYGENVIKNLGKREKELDFGVSIRPMFRCLKIAEEMAHYPYHIKLEEYQNQKQTFRGNFVEEKLLFNADDFAVDERRCPVMVHMEEDTRKLKSWFPEDIFPIYERPIFACAKNPPSEKLAAYISANAWKDLRPFDDSHPFLLEYLVT